MWLEILFWMMRNVWYSWRFPHIQLSTIGASDCTTNPISRVLITEPVSSRSTFRSSRVRNSKVLQHNPTEHRVGELELNVGITDELSNRISYYVCTLDDVSYAVCCVVVATPPVQVPLTKEHQNDESAPCLTVRDRSNLSTVSMNDVSDVASLITLILTPAELSPWARDSC